MNTDIDESGERPEFDSAEEALQAAEQNFRNSIEGSPSGIRIVNAEGELLYANQAILDIYGYSSIEELKTTPVKKRYIPESYIEHLERREKRRSGRHVPSNYEISIVRKDGEIRHLLVYRTEVVWNGESQFQVIYLDITEQKRTELALQTSHRFLQITNQHTEMSPLLKEFAAEVRKITGCVAAGIRILDKEGNIPYQAYEGFSQRFYESESPLSIKSDQCMCINVIKGITEPRLSFYTEGGSFYMNGATRFLATVSEEDKGQTRNVCNQHGYESVALIPIRIQDRILGLIHVADPRENMVPLWMVQLLEDVGKQLGTTIERVQNIKALKESEIKYRTLIGRLGEGVYQADTEGNYITLNQAGAKIFGFDSPEQVIGKYKTLDFYADLGVRQEMIEDIKKSGSWRREIRAKRRDGSIIWLYVNNNTTIDEKGNIVGYEGVFTDITERRQAEELSRTITDNSPIAIYIARDGIFEYVNPHFLKESGYSKSELLGKSTLDIVHPADRDFVRANAIRILKNNRPETTYEFRVIGKKGNIFWLVEKVTSIQYQGKRAVMGFSIDITWHKQMEESLSRLEKMEAVGRVAAGLAHDLNNMLTPIQGYSELMLKSLNTGDPRCEYMEEIRKAGERAASLTRQLLTFSRKQEPRLETLNLNTIISAISNMLQSITDRSVEIVTNLTPDIELIRADRGQLEQVIMNLVINARDAMPNGGRLTISTEDFTVTEEQRWIMPEARPGRFVCLSVADTGTGMTGEIMQHLFEPFFTTKEPGKGTGLGLSVVYGIVKQHQGWIDVQSKPDKGSTFKIYLPIVSTK